MFLLQDDFYLMCNNAMVYNAPETIYYKAAKKLLQTGSKLLSPVSFLTLWKFFFHNYCQIMLINTSTLIYWLFSQFFLIPDFSLYSFSFGSSVNLLSYPLFHGFLLFFFCLFIFAFLHSNVLIQQIHSFFISMWYTCAYLANTYCVHCMIMHFLYYFENVEWKNS